MKCLINTQKEEIPTADAFWNTPPKTILGCVTQKVLFFFLSELSPTTKTQT